MSQKEVVLGPTNPSSMFSSIEVRNLENSSDVFQKTVAEIDRTYVQTCARKFNAVSGYDEFTRLYETTIDLYKLEFPELWLNYVPLYNTVWRQDLQVPLPNDNIHQDESIYHFGIGGYRSRMVNLWVCLQKQMPQTLKASDLGIFIVEAGPKQNNELYSRLIAANSHFNMKRPGQLIDNSHVGGPVVQMDPGKLVRKEFSFSSGTAILFSSHLLHGTQRVMSSNVTSMPGFRTALTSIWVHKDDFNRKILDLSDSSYADLYLGGHDAPMRENLKRYFPDQCKVQEKAISQICALSRHHLASI